MRVLCLLLWLTLALGVPLGYAQQSETIQDRGAAGSDFVTLANRAYALHRERKDEEALAIAERAEQAASQGNLPESNDVARAWNSLGMLMFELDYNERAKQAYEKAFALANTISAPDADLRCNLLNNLGQVEGRLGQYEKAREHLEEALALLEASSTTTPRGLAVALDNLGLAYDHDGDLDKAEKLHLKALEIFEREAGMVDDAATTTGNLAMVYRLKRDYRRAEAYALRAFDTHQRLFGLEHDHTLLDAVNLAQLYMDIGDTSKAEALVNLLVRVGGDEPGKRHRAIANYLYFLAEQAQFHWELGLAERLAARAVDISRTILGPYDAETLRALVLQASIQAARSDFPSAEKNYRWLLNAYSGQRKTKEAAGIMVQLAKVHVQWGNSSLAIELLQRAIADLRALHDVDLEELASALGNLAGVYFKSDQVDAAARSYNEALELVKDQRSSEERPWLLHGRGLLWYHVAKYKPALEDLERARDIWIESHGQDHPFVATTIANLALVAWAQGDPRKTIEYLSETAKVRERELQRTLTIGTERQRLAFARDLQDDLYKILSFCFGAQSCNGDAARLSATLVLQRKGRVLDAMTDTMQRVRMELPPEDRKLLYRLEEVHAEISRQISPTLVTGDLPRVPVRLEQLLKREAELQSALSYKSASYQSALRPVSLDAVQQALPTEATLIEFVQYTVFDPIRVGHGSPWRGDRYAALVLRRGNEPRWFDLGAAETIDRAVQAFRARLRNYAEAYRRAEAQSLYRLVIGPLESALPKPASKTPSLLLIAPDGLLNIIPFGLLGEKKDQTLLNRFVVDYLTSGRELLGERRASESSNVVVIANPSFNAQVRGDAPKSRSPLAGRGGFTALPGTKREADALQDLFSDLKLFSEDTATVAALKAIEHPAVLHIATHGVFLRIDNIEPQRTTDLLQIGDESYFFSLSSPSPLDNPLLFSGLALAGANKPAEGTNYGVITALEISGLQLQGTELVVLSACETGLGTTRRGEEFAGLRRAISIAGAASQVTSLWKVADAATSQLMREYYRLILEGKGRAEALQLAQQRIRNDHPQWRHPYFWAAFIPSGNWTPIAQLASRPKKRAG